MRPLTIEINGTGIHNRGAELMAIAVAQQMRNTFPGVRIAVSREFGPRAAARKHDFLVTWESMGRHIGMLRTLVASALSRGQEGVIDPAEVDLVLDASGFAFSDQWGIYRARRLATKMSRSYRRRQPLILLPQALGPFRDPDVARWCAEVLLRAELVCARDERSRAAVAELVKLPRLRRYPDFTACVEPLRSGDVDLPSEFCAIVPNFRMMDKAKDGELYLKLLHHAILSVRARHLNPVFVLHDAAEDHRIPELMGERVRDIEVLTHADPRVLKWILGRAGFVIGSRYHALISSLSQGVPCIGMGWSHKYPELFSDFSCSELLIVDMADHSLFDSALDRLCDTAEHARLSSSILSSAGELKGQTASMWKEVEAIVDRVRSR